MSDVYARRITFVYNRLPPSLEKALRIISFFRTMTAVYLNFGTMKDLTLDEMAEKILRSAKILRTEVPDWQCYYCHNYAGSWSSVVHDDRCAYKIAVERKKSV